MHRDQKPLFEGLEAKKAPDVPGLQVEELGLEEETTLDRQGVFQSARRAIRENPDIISHSPLGRSSGMQLRAAPRRLGPAGHLAKCNEHRVRGVEVNYKSAEKHVGSDAVELLALFPSGFAWEVHYDISVR